MIGYYFDDNDLGYTGSLVNGEMVYMPANASELAAVQALTKALGMAKDVVDLAVVNAVNQRLGTNYMATEIVNNIAAITVEVEKRKPAKRAWLWPTVIGAGLLGVVGIVWMRRKG
jgi:hypothetical protein